MWRLLFVLLVACTTATLPALACQSLADDDEQAPKALAFQSVMIGLGQVPPVASTGRGVASYLLTGDGGTLYYALEGVDVSSTITAAHIHLGRTGQNGEVVANLCGAGSAPACTTQGVIATGTITASNLVGPLSGHPLSDLVVAMTASAAYTNVHTSTFPDGEIRGQVLLVAVAGEQGNENGQGNNGQGNNGNQGNDDHDNQDNHDED
jgi:hypothetical protein